MRKVVDEYNLGVRDLIILTLNERMPNGHFKKCRIDGKEYEIHFMHYRCDSVEKAMDAMFRNFAIQAPDMDSFVGKEVEFV